LRTGRSARARRRDDGEKEREAPGNSFQLHA